MISKKPMKHMAVIPARLESQRLKEKPLQLINQTPLIKFVAEAVKSLDVFDQVYVATDSKKIMDLFKGSEIKPVMTSKSHQSGTDRIFEASDMIDEDFDTVFNIQGDEPFLYKEDILNLKQSLEDGFKMVSVYEAIETSDLEDLNKVKVLLNNKSEAVYFSRFKIPFSREAGAVDSKHIGKHVGLYAYHKSFLKSFCEHPIGYFEKFEKLEQLRALQMGEKIKMVFTKNKYQGVDTLDDLKHVNEVLKNKHRMKQ